VTPKAGLGSILVYGRAYPQSVSTATLPYTIPAGQVYVAKGLVQADYHDAPTFTTNVSDHQGHTSLFLSQCADAVQTRYLVGLSLPAVGTVCEQDHVPFTGP
jgi:hypothetical protein